MTYVDTTQRDEYTATSGQTVFAYTFRILADSDLKVYNEGVLQTLTTHYTVSGAGDAGGGNVTFVTGVTLNNTVIILRNMPNTQNADYTVSGLFPAETHEQALDKLAMKCQDIDEKMSRSLKFPETSTLNDIDVPEGTSATDRAGKVVAWNTAGDDLELIAATNIDSTSLIAVKGDIIQGGTAGDAEKLAIGADGTIPYVSTDLLAYANPWGVAWKKGADIASASPLVLGTDGNYFDVTGTTGITSISTWNVGGMVRLHFDGALTITHHSTDLILPNGSNITTIAGDEATFIEYASGDWRLVGWGGHTLEHTHASAAQGGLYTRQAGSIVQIVNTQTGAVATGTTTIPFDDTIPQNTEGDQYMTLAVTPTNTNNKLKIDVVFQGAISVGEIVQVALFQDSTANALAAMVIHNSSVDQTVFVAFSHYMTAGTTSATTFKIRAGTSASGTLTFNGASGARKYGGVMASSITITEIMV